ncbi:alpha/beta hydrolase [Acinetobacter sp. ANC 4648]|uniref:alpha/beta hydrolase n=1 Tax=Acinetobacter sp. ANC 4648 TaxID=1977875 RepID=UPI000A3568D0|nr:alpha/beta hydrolase [Acinetobacter sp. ANC 4648]OTG81589.1 esterase [Acinetobacter sp. ANC 4648]
MTHTIIVPGVGGSDYDHWQSWLQRQLMSCSRVQQQDWNLPILSHWIANFVSTISKVEAPIQIVAHSFGCLTSVAALNQYPEIASKIKKLILVAPANPSRFGENGFARDSIGNYAQYFHQLKINVPTELLISENDPWLNFEDAQTLAKSWKIKPSNLGRVGHINVDSGFGAFPEIYDYLVSEKNIAYINKIDDTKLFFKFAI